MAVAKVNAVSPDIGAMDKDWRMIEALMGGTPAMRHAREQFLPKWASEQKDSYDERLAVATLFPAFRRTTSVMASKPFAKQANLSDDTPEQIKVWAEDIDLEGVGFHAFSAEMFAEALTYGLAGILVDAPRQPDAARPMTVAEQRGQGIRPYFVRVMHRQILGYRLSTKQGPRRLEQLRIKECVKEADGDFGEVEIERVRVLSPGAWALWQKIPNSDDWEPVDEGQSGLDYIPFVPLYGWRVGLMHGAPPLRDLAYLNVKHWQSQSDQDTILHVARVPILALSGGDDKSQLTVGTASAVKLPAGAKLEFVEHTGAAIDAGAKSLGDLEEQMIQTGAELLVKQPGSRTATESNNDAEANKSDLQRIAEGFEASLDKALAIMADYANLPSGGKVSLFKDYGATSLSDASAQLIVNLRAAQIITATTAIDELKRRGELSPDLDTEKEATEAALEAPIAVPGATTDANPNR